MKYKVIQNNTIIAVLDGVTYCKQQRNGLVVPCSLEKGPCGILSEEGTPWHLEGLPEFTQGEYITVRIVEITDSEYDELKALLGEDEEIVEPEPAEDTPGAESGENEAGSEGDGGSGNEDGTATQEGDDGQTEGDTETVQTPEPVMSIGEMRQRIIALENALATQTAINAALTEYHVKASDSSINSIAKIRGVSSETATEVSVITNPQEVVQNDDSGDN